MTLHEASRVVRLVLLASLVGCGGGAYTGVPLPPPPPTSTLAVSVRLDGGGSATVISDPPGISCAGSGCTKAFPLGTTVTLTAAPGSARFVRWSGACAGAATTCTLTLSADSVAEAVFLGANYVFATSTLFAPVGLTLAGADAECGARAREAGLPGTYAAWLSTSTVDARARLGVARGWVRTDGLPFADSLAALTVHQTVLYPPVLDEQARPVARTEVITGTRADGTLEAGMNCDDWSSTTALVLGGTASSGPGSWTEGWGSSCLGVLQGHLYCFGVDAEQALPVSTSTGRKAFLSTGTWGVGGGVAALDALCAVEASAAGLTGTFRALVATSTASAASRFDLGGSPWVRIDGVPVVRLALELVSGDLLAPMAVHADGTYSAVGRAWTGASTPGQPGALASTCGDWTSGIAASLGGVGFPVQTQGTGNGYRTFHGFFHADTTSCGGAAPECPVLDACDAAASVYCLER